MTQRCVLIGPRSGATLHGNERDVLIVADGRNVFLQVDFESRTVFFGDRTGPRIHIDFSSQPAPVVQVRGDPHTHLYEVAVAAFEDFAQAFRESYENDPAGGASVKRINELCQELPLEEVLSRFSVEGDNES